MRHEGSKVLTTKPGLPRSEEHTSELQSQSNLVCRLLLEKKKTYILQSNRPSLPPAVQDRHTWQHALANASYTALATYRFDNQVVLTLVPVDNAQAIAVMP